MWEVLVGIGILILAAFFADQVALIIIAIVLIAAIPVARRNFRAVHQHKRKRG